jgi:hypothetical protein
MKQDWSQTERISRGANGLYTQPRDEGDQSGASVMNESYESQLLRGG